VVVYRSALAPMGMASFCAGVRHKRYNGQRDLAPKKIQNKTRNQHH